MAIIILSVVSGILLFLTISFYFLWQGAMEIIKGMKIALKDRGIALSEQELSTAMAKLKLRDASKWERT